MYRPNHNQLIFIVVDNSIFTSCGGLPNEVFNDNLLSELVNKGAIIALEEANNSWLNKYENL